MHHRRSLSLASVISLALAPLALLACSSDDSSVPAPTNDAGIDGAQTADAAPAADGGTGTDTDAAPGTDGGTQDSGPATPALYALSVSVYANGASHTYVPLLASLGAQATVKYDTAHEFGGYAPVDALGGKLIVTNGEAPKITRYNVTDTGVYTEDGSVNFAAYASTPVTRSIFVNATKVYTPFDGTSHVVWDAGTFTLGNTTIAAPANLPAKRDAFLVARGYGHELVGGLAFQPYYWSDDKYTKFSGTSSVQILDTATDTTSAVVDVQIPHAHITTVDDDGNFYVSNGQFSVAPAVLDTTQPRNGIVRIKKGEKAVDPSFNLKFKDLTGGHEGGNFFYVGNGVGFFNVYYAEKDNVTPTSDPKTINNSANYHLWTFDLKTNTAKLMDGIDFSGGQYVAWKIDGRTLVGIPNATYSSTAIYEALPTGVAQKLFDADGWVYNVVRVR